jgi:hypothetical protein
MQKRTSIAECTKIIQNTTTGETHSSNGSGVLSRSPLTFSSSSGGEECQTSRGPDSRLLRTLLSFFETFRGGLCSTAALSPPAAPGSSHDGLRSEPFKTRFGSLFAKRGRLRPSFATDLHDEK